MKLELRFATNRNPIGDPPTVLGMRFSPVHPHDLRFGRIEVDVAEPLSSGTALAGAIAQQVDGGQCAIEIYAEDLSVTPPTFGSARMFAELKQAMDAGRPTVLFIHGYNVSFGNAVGSAMALQRRSVELGQPMNVVLYSWPSDGSMLPFVAYHSDRDDAAASGLAFSRGFQKLHRYLAELERQQYCLSPIHLVCHSMGNFVLENTLWHLRVNAGRLPRTFSEIALCSADVDADALEHESKLARLPEIARRITVYYNRGDEALRISDMTKGNPDRLGQSGPRRPLDVPSGVVNVDCSDIVGGLVEHSYYLDEASRDLIATLSGEREDRIPRRTYVASSNAYRLTGP